MNRSDLIRKLLTTMHLNVAERAELRPLHISRDELRTAIGESLAYAPYFPPHARP